MSVSPEKCTTCNVFLDCEIDRLATSLKCFWNIFIIQSPARYAPVPKYPYQVSCTFKPTIWDSRSQYGPTGQLVLKKPKFRETWALSICGSNDSIFIFFLYLLPKINIISIISISYCMLSDRCRYFPDINLNSSRRQ